MRLITLLLSAAVAAAALAVNPQQEQLLRENSDATTRWSAKLAAGDFRNTMKGYRLNPTPQSITSSVDATPGRRTSRGDIGAGRDPRGLDIEAGFNFKGKFVPGEIAGFKQSRGGIAVTLTQGKKALKQGVKEMPGAYRLAITPKGVAIDAYDADGTFYALNTLRQLTAQCRGTLPLVTVNDWPSFPQRGLVEGFYGTPWSHETRLSLLDFLGENKMNVYVYGPKDDPYHRTPDWRKPYPENEARHIRELAGRARKNHVQFVWAIHPGGDIRWDKADYDSLLNKFNHMYDLGVRRFAIFFDDIDGIGNNSSNQARLVNDITRDFVRKKGDVGEIMICPTDYSELWAKPGSQGQLSVYGRELTPTADVFWTGSKVCGDITPATLEFVDSRIKRPALIWWNYPVTDYVKNRMLQGPVYGLDPTLDTTQMRGLLSNPMEYGNASKVALFQVGDWTWNPTDYRPLKSWERALRRLMPECYDAYRTFAIHNADTKYDGYRRAESWETDSLTLENATPTRLKALRAEFDRIAAAPGTIRTKCGDRALVRELDPWLTEFEKLGKRGRNVIELVEAYQKGDKTRAAELLTLTEWAPDSAHMVSGRRLTPMLDSVRDEVRRKL